jgi:hypothetical protein
MLKKQDVTVPQWSGRDDGKVFRITEMPAAQAEKWAWRLFIAMKGTTAQVPPEIAQLGMVGVAIRGLNSFLAADVRFQDIEPLLDEMMTCVTRVRDPAHPDVATNLIDGDVEEVQTRGWLRSEVLSLHVGFSVTDALLTLICQVMAPVPALSNTQTSQP